MEDMKEDGQSLNTNIEKNQRLADLVMGHWANETIHSVKRVEEDPNPAKHGWEADLDD